MNAITHLENTALAVNQASPVGMMMQALQSGMTVEQMQGMLAIQKDWEANEARKAYVVAMAEFKRDPPEIFKRKNVAFGETSYNHATLGDVTTAIVNGLAAHGISHRWDTKQHEGGRIVVTCILTHNMGHSESTALEAQPDNSGKKNGIQQMASTVTYLQRYTLLGASGLATKDMEDDDGRASGGESLMLAEWTEKVNAALTVEVLTTTRQMAGKAFQDAGDVAGWNALKLIAKMKSDSLKVAA